MGTVGCDKDRFTVQLSIAKDGTKLPPYVISKGAAFNGTREYHADAVACELKNRLCDSNVNEHPPEDKICLTCNDTGVPIVF